MRIAAPLGHKCRAAWHAGCAGLIAAFLAARFAGAQSGTNTVVQGFDLTNPADAAGWAPTHDLAPFT